MPCKQTPNVRRKKSLYSKYIYNYVCTLRVSYSRTIVILWFILSWHKHIKEAAMLLFFELQTGIYQGFPKRYFDLISRQGDTLEPFKVTNLQSWQSKNMRRFVFETTFFASLYKDYFFSLYGGLLLWFDSRLGRVLDHNECLVEVIWEVISWP